MKKLLTILLILSTGLTYGQTMPWFGAGQSTQLRTYMKNSLDSAKLLWKLEFLTDAKKADTALYKTLPVISKEALGIVTTLPAVVKSLEDKIKQVQAPAVDTSWKVTVAAQQATIAAQAKLITDLAAQLSELKLWADKVKLINFK